MKTVIAIIIVIFAILFFTKSAYAQDKVSEASANLVEYIPQNPYVLDTRVKALRNVLERYNSPLASEAENYVKYADEYGVDWRLLPSIAGLESTFGKFLIPGSYNAYGWGSGRIYFESWEDGIRTINKALRERYMDRGATDVWSIGPIYAESKTWSVRVNYFMSVFEKEYQKLSLFSAIEVI